MRFHSTPLLALAFRLRLLDIAQSDQHLLNLLMQPGQYIHPMATYSSTCTRLDDATSLEFCFTSRTLTMPTTRYFEE